MSNLFFVLAYNSSYSCSEILNGCNNPTKHLASKLFRCKTYTLNQESRIGKKFSFLWCGIGGKNKHLKWKNKRKRSIKERLLAFVWRKKSIIAKFLKKMLTFNLQDLHPNNRVLKKETSRSFLALNSSWMAFSKWKTFLLGNHRWFFRINLELKLFCKIIFSSIRVFPSLNVFFTLLSIFVDKDRFL